MRHSRRFCPSGKLRVEGAREMVRTLAQVGQTGGWVSEVGWFWREGEGGGEG